MRESLASRLGWAALQVGVVIALWLLIGLLDILAIGLIATIVISTIVPHRWSNLVSGLGIIGTGVALNIAHGLTHIPLILCILGAVIAALAVHSLITRVPHQPKEDTRDVAL